MATAGVRAVRRAILLSAALAALGGAAHADVVEAPAPFARFAERVRVGLPTEVASLALIPLWVAPDKDGVGLGDPAWVGLSGIAVRIDDAPEPLGAAAVSVVNPLAMPLEVPRGETIRGAAGSDRMVDRTVWVPPLSAAFLPVVNFPGAVAVNPAVPPVAPRGPYEPTGFRASPAVLAGLRRGDWLDVVRGENRALGVPVESQASPAAGLATRAFADHGDALLSAVEAVRAKTPGLMVGIAVVDEQGPATILLEGDAGRWKALWPGIAKGLALDALARRAGGVPLLSHEVVAASVEKTVAALADLREEPLSRPAFGDGEVLRWPGLETAHARWIGLAVEGRPVTAAWHRLGPAPVIGNPPQPQPPHPPAPPPPPEPPSNPPSPGAIDRDPRPNGFEERYGGRRDSSGDPTPGMR